MTLSKLVKELGFDADVLGLERPSKPGRKKKQGLQTKSQRWLLPTRSRIRLRQLMPGQTWSKSVKRWWSNGQNILHADWLPPQGGGEGIPRDHAFEIFILSITSNLGKIGNAQLTLSKTFRLFSCSSRQSSCVCFYRNKFDIPINEEQ